MGGGGGDTERERQRERDRERQRERARGRRHGGDQESSGQREKPAPEIEIGRDNVTNADGDTGRGRKSRMNRREQGAGIRRCISVRKHSQPVVYVRNICAQAHIECLRTYMRMLAHIYSASLKRSLNLSANKYYYYYYWKRARRRHKAASVTDKCNGPHEHT